jgi:ubiquinone/menaquinone biosynthesis C-methylase UbiE
MRPTLRGSRLKPDSNSRRRWSVSLRRWADVRSGRWRRAGERILDVGCGTGRTVVELAAAVQPGGTVLGVDISELVVTAAAGRVRDTAGATIVVGDVQTRAFAPASFDAAFSRFGVMFFADPPAAFANIRRALRPGGRLAFVCWRALEDNELDFLPLRAASPYLPTGAVTGLAAEAFSFAEPDKVRGLLSRAGFDAVEIIAHDQAVGSGGLEPMLQVCLGFGPLGRFLRENPEYRDLATAPVRAALAAKDGPGGVTLNAATWIVTARRPD